MKKLVHQCNNYVDHSVGERPIVADYSALTEKFESSYNLDITKLVNVPTSLNNLKAIMDDVDVGKSCEKYKI